MSDNAGERQTTSDHFGSESSYTPVIDQLPKKVKINNKPPQPARKPKPMLAWKAVMPSGRKIAAGGLVLGLLLIAGLAFLAVRALGDSGCQDFSAARTTVGTTDGFSVNVLPDAMKGTYGVKLAGVALADFVSSGNADLKAAAGTLPEAAKPASSFYTIHGCSNEPKLATLRMRAPADAQNLEQYAVFGWDAAAKRWRWLGADVDPATRSIQARVSKMPAAVMLMQVAQAKTTLSAELTPSGATLDQPQLGKIAQVSPIGLYLGDFGQIVGDRSKLASAGGARVTPIIRNWSERGEVNRTLLKNMLESERSRAAHILNLVDLTTRLGDYAGVEIDYRGVDASMRAAYSDFATKLGDALHAKGKTLDIGMPAPARTNSIDPATMWNSEGYDARALATAADQVKLDLSANPALFQRDNLDALMAWAQANIGKDKLSVVVPALSVKQNDAGATQLISYQEALEPLGKVVPEKPLTAPLLPGQKLKLKVTGVVDPATVQYDENTGTYRYGFTDANGQAQTVWLNTPSALKRKLDLLAEYNVREISVRGLDAQGNVDNIAKVMSSLDQAQQQAGSVGTLAWTVNGNPVAGNTSMSFEWTAPNQPGKYAIGASIAGDNDRGVVNVEVLQPTPTPLPPTPTPRPVVVAAAPAAAPVAAKAPAAAAAPKPAAPVSEAPVPRPSGSSAWLGVGAHIDTGNNMAGYLARMRNEAGMNWVKIQSVFDGGTPDISWIINAAHANGIKVLVGAIGNRARFRDPSYYPVYAGIVANFAKMGADAVEIWNEPNLDREVGGSFVSPENYTELLKQSYGAIKGANPGTLVVGGAAAPTGYFGGGCTPNGCDDGPFLARARAAGAGNYMDCQGAHFNGSPHPPSVTSGGNPGGHPSWYFYGTLDTTYNSMGKPVCFTEMGYVTKDGVLSELPGGFSWGNGITLANQAAWIGDAISRSRQSGKVRMVIIWNANFHRIDGSDPQVGYSIFRPDGSCPACGPIRGASQ